MKTILHKSLKRMSFTLIVAMISFSTMGQSVYDVISNSPNHTTLTAAIDAAGLDATLDDPSAEFTVFAPDDNAFNDALAELGITANDLLMSSNLSDILTYHVLAATVEASDINNGDIVTPVNNANTLKLTVTSTAEVFVNQSKVMSPDLTATNGVVHSMNEVLFSDETVANIAIDNGFTILVAAVVEAELLPALSDPFEEFTVFAPSDAAFNTFLSDMGITANDLLADPNLASILLYHTLGMEVMSADLTNGYVTTLNSDDILVDLSNGVMINDAMVTMADVDADNGVVHAIDKVLNPGTASTDKYEIENLSIYPNPTTHFIQVENMDNSRYIILNNAGQKVKEGVIESNKVSVAELNTGMYFINILKNEKIFSSQFLKK